MFRERAGYGFADEREFYYDREFSDQVFDRLAEQRCSHIVLPFDKGFGPTYARDELDFLLKVAERARSHGLRIGLYVRCDYVVPDSIRDDYPDVEEWLIAEGTYGPQQEFRRKIDFAHPGTYRRLEDSVRLAVREFGTDLIHLDGLHFAGRPEHGGGSSCALLAFREWLGSQTLPASVNPDRAGIPSLSRESLPSVAVGPEIKLWHRFLWEFEAAAIRHLRHFIYRLDPGVAVTGNPYFLSWDAYYRLMSQRIEWYFDWLDGVWLEDHEHFFFDRANRKLRSRLAAVSYAREHKLPVCQYQWWPDDRRLEPSLAFTAASNGLHLSCTGFTFRYMPHFTLGHETKTRLAAWAERVYPNIGNWVPWAEVAVFRHAESLAWNHGIPWQSYRRITDLLSSINVPYRVVDHAPETTSDIRVLILPDSECVSLDEFAQLSAWVESGGAVVVTRRTATHDKSRARRPRSLFEPWFDKQIGTTAYSVSSALTDESRPLRWFAWISEDFPEYTTDEFGDAFAEVPMLVRRGRGSASYWPGIVPDSDDPDFTSAIRSIVGQSRVSVDGPDELLVIATQPQVPDGRYALHLLNSDPESGSIDMHVVLDNLTVALDGVLSPDRRQPDVESEAGGVRVTNLDCYVVLVLDEGDPSDTSHR